jgi:NAD(P)-dependent dehydrogenase (short-subunit alcohol dehydrogenase family)
VKAKTCLVTGGANGIGRCIAETFIEAGYFVAVVDVDEVSGKRLEQRYNEDAFMFYRGDITEKALIHSFVDTVISKRASVDVLVNNACLGKGGLNTCSYEDFNYVLSLGVTAPFYLSKLLMPYFNKGASIINIASTRAFMSQADTESYTAAKGGILALTHGMSVSLSGKVRVNSISPGWVDTGLYQDEENYQTNYEDGDIKQHPAGKVGDPKDIAKMALFLASDNASFITGENITIDGGMTKQMIYHNDYGWKYEV